MPLSFSIAEGIGLGFISYVLIALVVAAVGFISAFPSFLLSQIIAFFLSIENTLFDMAYNNGSVAEE